MTPRAEGTESVVVHRLTDGIEPPEVRDILVRCLGGEMPTSDALVALVAASGSPAAVRHAVDEVTRRADQDSRADDRMVRDRVDDLTQLVVDAENGVDRVADRARDSELPPMPPAVATEGREALWQLPEEQRVRALDALLDTLASWGSLHREHRALELGCGTGRQLELLAARVAEAHGVEGEGMLAGAARRRTEALSNAFVQDGRTGHDLAAYDARTFDMALAVDYFAALGADAAREEALAEVARVLVPGGHLVIVNLTHDGDGSAEAEALRVQGAPLGLVPGRLGERPVASWRAVVHQLVRR